MPSLVAYTLVEQSDGVVQVVVAERVYNETRLVLTSTVLATCPGELEGRRHRGVGRVIGRTTSTRAMAGAGLKKWIPHAGLAGWWRWPSPPPPGWRCWWRDGTPPAHRAELGEEQLLDGQVLDHRLDHQVAVGQRTEVVEAGDPGGNFSGFSLGPLAFLDLLGQRLRQSGHHGVGTGLAAAAQHDLVARGGGHLDDTRTHDARPDDSYPCN